MYFSGKVVQKQEPDTGHSSQPLRVPEDCICPWVAKVTSNPKTVGSKTFFFFQPVPFNILKEA